MGHPVKIKGDEIARAIEYRSSQPFQDMLAKILSVRPDPGALKVFAQKHPDRWAQAIAIFGRLAGYHERVEVNANVSIEIARLSDAELIAELQRIEAEIGD